MPSLEPVDHDPFASSEGGRTVTIPGKNGAITRVEMEMGGGPKLEPVDHDPFATDYKAGAKDVIKSAGTGVVRGVLGLGGMVGDLTDLGAAGIKKATDFVSEQVGAEPYKPPGKSVLENIPTSGSLTKNLESVTGELYKPQTTAGHYAETIGEFLPATIAGPGGVVRKVGMQAVIPGAASEAAGQATQGTALEPYARAAAGIGAGLGGALISRPGNTAQALRSQLGDITPTMVDDARSLMQTAQAKGIKLTWTEALSQAAGRPVGSDTMRILESAPASRTRMQEFYADRPQQIDQAALNEFSQVAPGTRTPSQIGPRIRDAANESVGDVRKAINNAAEPYYQAAEGVLLTKAEMAHVKQIPGFEEARDAVRSSPQLNSYVKHLPDNSVGFLNEVKKYFDQQSQNAASKFNQGANQQVAAVHGKAAEAIKQVAIAKSGERVRSSAIPEDAPSELFRGHGRENKASAYGSSTDVPILGEGKYYAFDKKAAERYGPNIEKNRLEDISSNPMIITDGNQWRELTRSAGWEFPNPFGQGKAKVEAATQRLQDAVKARGHDGVVVWWNDATKYDFGPKGENIKLLRDVFDKPQAIAFKGVELPPHVNNYETALEIQKLGREKYLDPLLQGPLGRLAKKDITTQKAIDTLFPSSPLPNSHNEIHDAVTRLTAKNPGAATQLVRAHMESVFNEATKSLQGGANQAGGAKFAKSLVGNIQQRANLQAAVEALPNGKQLWQGVDNFLEAAEATGTRQAKGSLTAFNAQELKAMSGSGLVGEAVKTGLSPGKWWSVVNDKWSQWKLGRNLDELARIFTDPKSAPVLKRIAGMPSGSREAGYLVSRLILQANQASQASEPRRQ